MNNNSKEQETSLFLRGEGFFTTLLQTSNGYAFLNRHLKRLKKSCAYFGFENEWDEIEQRFLKELFNYKLKYETQERVRVSFFEVNHKLDYGIQRSLYDRPKNFSLYQSEKRRNERMMPTFFKDHFYLPYTLEKRQRNLKKDCDLLILSNDSLVCESSMGNVFFRIGETLITPKNKKSFYSGITREVLIEIFDDLKIKFECRDFKFKEIENVDEIWITSSLKRIIRIDELDEVKLSNIGSRLPKVLEKFIEKERSESRES